MPAVDITALDGDLLLQGIWEGLGRPTCHLTGGYLRDRLMGRVNSDLDLVLPGREALRAAIKTPLFSFEPTKGRASTETT